MLVAQQADRVVYNFAKADSVANVYRGYSLKDLHGLAYNLTHSLPTDHEKFRAIYFWVCNNVGNDYEYFLLNKRKRAKCRGDAKALQAWNNEFSALVFQRLLKEQKAICSGYAYLLKELCSAVELPCVIVEGFGKTTASKRFGTEPDHSWNAVQLNGTWYLCDATWSSGAMDLQRNIFTKRFDARYFLADPEDFAASHRPVDEHWLLKSYRLELPASGPRIVTP